MQTSALSRLFSSLQRHGMVGEATWHAAGGDQTFRVGFTDPTETVFGQRGRVDAPAIEYIVSEAPGLDDREVLTIGGQQYAVVGAPVRRGDGLLAVAQLEAIA